ncbi:MAG: PAS domain S-box protein [Candidatus Ozemobacteraceae bacterium]
MKSKRKNQEDENSLRKPDRTRLGEELLSARSFSMEEHKKLVHELRVHQVELEVQNEELCRIREDLEKSQSKYFDLYDCAPVGYFTLGRNGKIQDANLTGANLLGMNKGKLLNRVFSDFVVPEFQDIFYFHSRKAMKSGVQESCELKLLKKNGEPFFAHLESMPIRNARNFITHLRTSVINIHEKKLLADLLKESADRNELLLNLLPHPAMLIDKDRKILTTNKMAKQNGAEIGDYCSPDFSGILKSGKKHTLANSGSSGVKETRGIFCLADDEENQQRLVTIIEDSNDAVMVLDLKGNIKAWNYQAEKIYGYSASEALKMSIYDLIPSRLQKETQKLLKDVGSGALVQPLETKRVTKDGCLVDILITATGLVKDKKIVAVATTERDISEHNRWLESIKKLPQRIILAQENERSRISQEIHSDFGQSLIALKMLISMTASTVGDGDSQLKSLFEKVKSQLSGIIAKARDLSHELAPPSLKYIGLVQTIKSLVETAKFQKNLKVDFFHRNMEKVNFQEMDIIIYRIVQEALNNIFKHAEATKARIKTLFHKSAFTLEISDDGKGFVQAKTYRSGGLGLDLMKEQVLLINGSLSIESQVGKGTTIKITVPIKEREEQ